MPLSQPSFCGLLELPSLRSTGARARNLRLRPLRFRADAHRAPPTRPRLALGLRRRRSKPSLPVAHVAYCALRAPPTSTSGTIVPAPQKLRVTAEWLAVAPWSDSHSAFASSLGPLGPAGSRVACSDARFPANLVSTTPLGSDFASCRSSQFARLEMRWRSSGAASVIDAVRQRRVRSARRAISDAVSGMSRRHSSVCSTAKVSQSSLRRCTGSSICARGSFIRTKRPRLRLIKRLRSRYSWCHVATVLSIVRGNGDQAGSFAGTKACGTL